MLSDFLRLIRGFVLFIGPYAAGKTSILRRLVTGNFEQQEPTLSFWEENIAKVRTIEIGGQLSLRKYWKVALDQNPASIFFVIDITKESDFKEYVSFIDEIQTHFPHISHKIILIANKIDLISKTPSYLKEVDVSIQCSAKTGEGMLDLLEMIASYKRKIKNTDEPINEDTEKKIAESLLKEFKGKF